MANKRILVGHFTQTGGEIKQTTMLVGQYTHALDTKGRVTIPSRHRDALSGDIVVTRGLDRCLTVYPIELWNEISAKVSAVPMTDPRGRALRRIFYADALYAEPDRQGRILIPDRLREHAGLELGAEVVIVGLERYLEIWKPQRWEEENARQMQMMDEDPALWENLQI